MTCERIAREALLERCEDDLLSPAEDEEVRAHVAACADCARRAAAVVEENRVLRGAATRAVSRAVSGPRRWRQGRAILIVTAVVALILVLLPIWQRRGDSEPGTPRRVAVLDLEISGAPGMGMRAPPCFAQCLLRARWVVVAEVETVEREEKDRLRRITATRREVLQGDVRAIPERITLSARRGISELGVHRFPARKGTKLVLVLTKHEGRIRLITGDTHSVAGVGMLVYLPSAHVPFETFADLRALVVAALAVRQVVETRPWEDAAGPLAEALRSGPGLRRELAVDLYSIRRRGHASDHVEIGWGREDAPVSPALPSVDAALAELIAVLDEPIGTISGKAFEILSKTGYARYDVWVGKLAAGDLGDDVYAHLREVGRTTKQEEKARLLAALRTAADEGAPLVRYLASGLLHEIGDSSRLATVLDIEIAPVDVKIVERLSVKATGMLWPRLRFLSGLAGRTFDTSGEARAWVASRPR